MQNTVNPGKRFFLRFFLFITGLCLVMLCLAGIALAMFWAPDQPVDELKARWAPSPSQFINVRGMSVHVRDEGRRDDPVPIVLIHGTSASLHTWEGWVAELKHQHRVISMDIPAFGLTGPRPDADYHSTTYARFILDLLDTMQVSRCIIAGNSLGGEVAWMVTVTAPQRVERLVLVDAGGYAFKAASIPLGFRIARMPQLAWIGEHVLPRHMMETSVKNVYGSPDKVTPALVDRYTAMTLREGNRHALGQRFQQTSSGTHAADIKNIHVPTLIIWGGQDRLIPQEYAKKFNQDIAGSKLVIFDKLGHVPHEEDPVATVAVVKDFLKM
ncbi:alpha/beta hydrolase [Undibacterium sp. TS12]|uniref:alpha/beta fold hydrolase n=1 Tax=Undibacterium sp. TS12 TaxID=2908202 RepID=UPI001F4D0FB5|nr:alpha/beta hydrolase [Undibacterium sp. TS12]MCH8621206.1 alpha/beta hydrolase [Undibacterium sp. TS12]